MLLPIARLLLEISVKFYKLNLIVFQFSQTYIEELLKFKGLQIFAYFSLASVVVKFLAILPIFTVEKLQNISGTHVATWRQKLASDLS